MSGIIQKRLAGFIITLSILGLFTVVVVTLMGKTVNGEIPAVSLVLLLVGLLFYYPNLIKCEETGAVSSMRVSVLMIVCTFCLITVKAGWGAQSLSDLSLPDWAWILAACLGGKAAQYFGEMIKAPAKNIAPALVTNPLQPANSGIPASPVKD